MNAQRIQFAGIIEEQGGQLILTGLDDTARQALRHFMGSTATITLEPQDVQADVDARQQGQSQS